MVHLTCLFQFDGEITTVYLLLKPTPCISRYLTYLDWQRQHQETLVFDFQAGSSVEELTLCISTNGHVPIGCQMCGHEWHFWDIGSWPREA